jgi:predicted component of type VI protein secretion system
LTRGKALNSQPVLRSVAVRVSEKVTTFGATDASQKLVETVENSPGRFPPAAEILCSARRHADRVIAFDPRQLANLLSTMDAIIDDTDARVEFHIPRKPEHPMLVTGAMASGLKLDAVIMPLVPPKPTGAQPEEEAEESPEVVELQKQLGLLKAKFEALEAERDEAMKTSIDKGAEITRLREVVRGREDAIDELGRSLRAVEFNARGLVEDRDRLQIENARLVGKLTAAPVAEMVRPAPVVTRPLSRRERLQGV